MQENDILKRLREELRSNEDPKIKESTKRFFKESVTVYGIKTAKVTEISKRYFKEIKDKTKDEIFTLSEDLFQSGYMEESFIACNWSYSKRHEFEEKDINTFERWISNHITNWASCDTLCNHTVGAFIEKYPKNIETLKKWAKSDNRWLRRASAVSLILPAKKGLFLKDTFEISDILINDTDDLVQKGYGWLLKEQSRKNQEHVFGYIMKKKHIMPRTALRYAIEKMPQDLKKQAMEK